MSSINICIHIYSVLLSVVIEMSKHVDGHTSDRWDNGELYFTI